MTTALAVQLHPNPTSSAKRAKLLVEPGFGRVFTDHMVTIRWSHGVGWHDAELKARAPLALDPAAAVFHYAQEIFEGLKAYRRADGGAALFRPEANAERFLQSAALLAMPALPPPLFLEAIQALVRADAAWIPESPGSLYLRPFMIATEAFLGVRPSREYTFCVIASPVGDYFKGDLKPVRVWVTSNYTRAAPGGTGAAKCGGNYAASLMAQTEAGVHGCDQVVLLDAAGRGQVEELGGMNIFFLLDGRRLVTSPLTGTLLPGVTRSSILALAQELGLEVAEHAYTFEAWQADAESGRLTEAFACGTAAVVAAIGEVRHHDGAFKIGGGADGPVTRRIRETLTGLQRGVLADPRGWVRRIALTPDATEVEPRIRAPRRATGVVMARELANRGTTRSRRTIL